jgi:hypothetical protein
LLAPTEATTVTSAALGFGTARAHPMLGLSDNARCGDTGCPAQIIAREVTCIYSYRRGVHQPDDRLNSAADDLKCRDIAAVACSNLNPMRAIHAAYGVHCL